MPPDIETSRLHFACDFQLESMPLSVFERSGITPELSRAEREHSSEVFMKEHEGHAVEASRSNELLAARCNYCGKPLKEKDRLTMTFLSGKITINGRTVDLGSQSVTAHATCFARQKKGSG